MKDKIKELAKKIIYFLLNPRLLLCIAVAWIITNGWSYIVFAVGTAFGIKWMIAVGGAYLAFLWLPISPEKIVTVAIAMFLMRWWFPQDKNTLGVLLRAHEKLKESLREQKEKRRRKREERRARRRKRDSESIDEQEK